MQAEATECEQSVKHIQGGNAYKAADSQLHSSAELNLQLGPGGAGVEMQTETLSPPPTPVVVRMMTHT